MFKPISFIKSCNHRSRIGEITFQRIKIVGLPTAGSDSFNSNSRGWAFKARSISERRVLKWLQQNHWITCFSLLILFEMEHMLNMRPETLIARLWQACVKAFEWLHTIFAILIVFSADFEIIFGCVLLLLLLTSWEAFEVKMHKSGCGSRNWGMGGRSKQGRKECIKCWLLVLWYSLR